jgi:nucleotide-binding universal stress UspA family protein
MNDPRTPTSGAEDIDTRPIVVGIDGTGSALAAARWAAAEARGRGIPLVLVHAASYIEGTDESGPEMKRARTILARAWSEVTRSAPGVEARTELVIDSAAEALAELSAGARMVAVGLTGSGDLDELPLGVPAVTLARHCGSPVVGVRSWPLPARAGREVLVGVRDVTEDAAAVEVAFQEAGRRGVALVVVHCDPGGSPARAEAMLSEGLAGWRARYPEVAVRVEIEHDTAAHALLRRSEHAELVIVGQRALGPISRAVFGSTSRWLLRHSHVPVLVTPKPTTTPTAPGLPVSGTALTTY